MVLFKGPNVCGKTSIGETVEWLLYGKTLSRTTGDELSKRETKSAPTGTLTI